MEFIPVLINIRSVHNVASMFRTADGAGCKEIVLVGYTPSPHDRFGRVRKDFQKVALGAEASFSVLQYATLGRALASLRKRGFFIVALEQHKKSVPYHLFGSLRKTHFKKKRKVALLVGNEVEGLSKLVYKKADILMEIPMRGKKESLNVSVAFGIAAYELVKSFDRM